MLAGSLGKLGYYMGDDPLPPTDSNPKGFFEDREVTRINEDLMGEASACPAFRRGNGWLAAMPRHAELAPTRALGLRIRAQTAHGPFCFKDPRFCYTLPAWVPYVHDPAILCIFREPATTANSVVTFCAQPYNDRAHMHFEAALSLWKLMYCHVLDHSRVCPGTFVFAHYEQVLNGSVASRLNTVLGADIDIDFPDVALRRSPASGIVGADVQEVYERLCSLAGYQPKVLEGS
jgi:hypothetical protein